MATHRASHVAFVEDPAKRQLVQNASEKSFEMETWSNCAMRIMGLSLFHPNTCDLSYPSRAEPATRHPVTKVDVRFVGSKSFGFFLLNFREK